jgi:acetyl-CoA acetyltransferase
VADVYRQAGITNPIEEIDAVECYVPFSWYEPMWMENLGFAEVGEGLEADRVGCDRPGREVVGELFGVGCCSRTRSVRRGDPIW